VARAILPVRVKEVVMRRMFSVAVLGAAVFVGTLITPGGRASAEKAADPVLVTNVPLPVTVGNFPAMQTVAGTLGVTQSGVWTVNLASPRPFTGRETYTIPDGAFGVAGGGTFVAPPNAAIETISVHVLLPVGQKPVASMLLPDDTGRTIGVVWVSLQFQTNNPAGDEYVGTVTNLHSPMGATTPARQVNFEIDRDGNSGIAIAQVTVIGLP